MVAQKVSKRERNYFYLNRFVLILVYYNLSIYKNLSILFRSRWGGVGCVVSLSALRFVLLYYTFVL